MTTEKSSAQRSFINNKGEINQPWVNIIRGVWLVSALAALAVLVASVPGYVLQISTEISNSASVVFTVLIGVPLILSPLLCLALAGLLFWRRSRHAMSLAVSFYLLGFGIISAGPVEALEIFLAGSTEIATVLGQLWGIPFALVFLLFPSGKFVPRWSRWVFPLFILISVTAAAGYIFTLPLWWTETEIITLIFFGALIIGFQVYRYRRVSTPIERQQTKWVLFGLVLFMLLNLMLIVPYEMSLNLPSDVPPPLWVELTGVGWAISLAVLPVSLSIALLRYQLWDIDLVIRRTLIYGLVTLLLGLGYFGGLTLLQSLLIPVTGQQSALAIVITTLMIAALFNPLRSRVQRVIDRAFYRANYDAQQTLEDFSEQLRDEVNLDDIQRELFIVITNTMQPEDVSLWLAGLEK